VHGQLTGVAGTAAETELLAQMTERRARAKLGNLKMREGMRYENRVERDEMRILERRREREREAREEIDLF
jgi:hypothetical protein